MANITNYLNKIKTAVYGKDVRGAIHDAIKQVYDDASVNHDNANMEVKMARGTHNTLNDRLDNVDEIQAQTNAQLSQKANVSEVVKRGQVTLDDCDSELLSAIHGGDGVEFNVLSIPREHSVDAGKLTADIAGYFNPVINEFVLGFIDVDGVVRVNDNFSITSTAVFFNVGTVLTVDDVDSVIHRVGLYENDEMVERIAVSAKEYLIPRSGYYRIQLYSKSKFEYTGKENEYVNKMKYSFDKTIVTNKNFNDYLDEPIEQKMKDINIFLNGIKVTFNYGNINNTGVIENPTTGTTNFYSDIIKADEFKSIKAQRNTANYKVNYALYDNDTFSERGNWVNSFELNNDKNCRLLLYFDGNVDLEEMLDNIDIDVTPNATTVKSITDEIDDLKRKSVDLNYIGGIMSCESDVKTIHTSFDDCWECFYQLQTQKPSSIYDIDFFNFLRTLHETYGAVFTVNCFNEYSGNTDYNLSNTPNTWKDEFQEAKSWLKFSFHAKDDRTNYNTSVGIKEDYDKFVDAIYIMTEDYECIDNFVRLGFFGGAEEQVSQITYENTENGIKGLLCADDDRLSYYFNKRVNDCVNKNGKYFDLNNNLVCIKTLPRFDSYSSNQLINIINENKHYSKNIEIFGHNTWLTTHQKSTIENMLKWANDNRYEHTFLMNTFNY